MSCEEIRILLSGYIDGELTINEFNQVKEHLTICEECRDEVSALRDFSNFIKRNAPKISSDFDKKTYVLNYPSWKEIIFNLGWGFYTLLMFVIILIVVVSFLILK